MTQSASDTNDDYHGQLPELVDKATLARFSRRTPMRAALAVLRQWLWIALAILLGEYLIFHEQGSLWFWPLYILIVMWVASRQHALALLMHEAAHLGLAKNKRINDVLGELLCAWPVFLSMYAYRLSHFQHHRFVNTKDDPDYEFKVNNPHPGDAASWQFPKTRAQIVAMLVKDALGLDTLSTLRFAKYLSRAPSNASETIIKRWHGRFYARMVFYVLMLLLLVFTGSVDEFILYWVMPFLTWFKVSNHVRSIAEHFCVANTHVYNTSRTVLGNWFDKLFMVPMNGNYHLEHHLYPQVPYYNLPVLHEHLMQQPLFRYHAHISSSYASFLLECERFSEQQAEYFYHKRHA